MPNGRCPICLAFACDCRLPRSSAASLARYAQAKAEAHARTVAECAAIAERAREAGAEYADDRRCVVCERPYVARHSTQKYCGDACVRVAEARTQADRVAAAALARAAVPAPDVDLLRQAQCPHCHAWVTRARLSTRRYCGDACKHRARRQRVAERRARRRAA